MTRLIFVVVVVIRTSYAFHTLRTQCDLDDSFDLESNRICYRRLFGEMLEVTGAEAVETRRRVCSKSRERKRLQEEAKLLLPSSVIFAISIHPSIKMIFGSKALSVAVLSAVVFSDEASAATAKKGKHNNKTLRKADRKLKGSKVSKIGC